MSDPENDEKPIVSEDQKERARAALALLSPEQLAELGVCRIESAPKSAIETAIESGERLATDTHPEAHCYDGQYANQPRPNRSGMAHLTASNRAVKPG